MDSSEDIGVMLGRIHSPEAVLNWKSQFGQDKWIIEYVFGGKRDGYFFEAGAHDGVRLSNTYLLEKVYGWQGICVEPGCAFEALRKNRSCICENVLLGPTEAREVLYHENGVLGGIVEVDTEDEKAVETERRTTTSLLTLLERHSSPKVIDYLSLDIEGHEYEVLKEFPFDQYKILAMTIEHNGNPELAQKLRALFESCGYRRFLSVGPEDWWLHRECRPAGEKDGQAYASRYFDLHVRYAGLLQDDFSVYKLSKSGVPVGRLLEVFWALFKEVPGRYKQTMLFRRLRYYVKRIFRVFS
jgi:FkbM family methyltransferase